MKNITLIFLFIPLFGLSQKDFIGKPIRFTYVEVAQNDYPKELTYNEAIKITKSVGNGWRLPTKEELNALHDNLVYLGVGGFEDNGYWSSTEGKNYDTSWGQYLYSGTQQIFWRNQICFVRAVRSF